MSSEFWLGLAQTAIGSALGFAFGIGAFHYQQRLQSTKRGKDDWRTALDALNRLSTTAGANIEALAMAKLQHINDMRPEVEKMKAASEEVYDTPPVDRARRILGLKTLSESMLYFYMSLPRTSVTFRRHTLLPLDDCLYALQATIPNLTRSSLHRCLQRHGISRLPDVEGDKPDKKKFKPYPIGYFHIDIAEVQTAEGKLYLYVAIDRTSKFAFVQLVKKTGRASASAFLEALIKAVPYKIHIVLTDNGVQFTYPPRYADGPTATFMTHMFDMRCRENGIEHRLTKIKHP